MAPYLLLLFAILYSQCMGLEPSNDVKVCFKSYEDKNFFDAIRPYMSPFSEVILIRYDCRKEHANSSVREEYRQCYKSKITEVRAAKNECKIEGSVYKEMSKEERDCVQGKISFPLAKDERSFEDFKTKFLENMNENKKEEVAKVIDGCAEAKMDDIFHCVWDEAGKGPCPELRRPPEDSTAKE